MVKIPITRGVVDSLAGEMWFAILGFKHGAVEHNFDRYSNVLNLVLVAVGNRINKTGDDRLMPYYRIFKGAASLMNSVIGRWKLDSSSIVTLTVAANKTEEVLGKLDMRDLEQARQILGRM